MQSGNEANVNVTEQAILRHPAFTQGHSNDDYRNSAHNELLTPPQQFDGQATVNTTSSAKKPSPPKQLRGSSSQIPITFARDPPYFRPIQEKSGFIASRWSPSSGGRRTKTLPLPLHSAQCPSFIAQAPLSMHPKVSNPSRGFNVSRQSDWSRWLELGVDFRGFPPKSTTKDVWKVLKEEGEILTIELFDDDKGDPSGRGRIRFRYAL